MSIKKDTLHAKGLEISIYTEDFKDEYISLTDIAKYRNADDPRFIIQNWMRSRDVIDFLGIWECLHNPDFNRVKFEAVKSEAGYNRFVMTPTKWIEQTGARGIICKAGRYGGGTFAHADIAMEFASTPMPLSRTLCHPNLPPNRKISSMQMKPTCSMCHSSDVQPASGERPTQARKATSATMPPYSSCSCLPIWRATTPSSSPRDLHNRFVCKPSETWL